MNAYKLIFVLFLVSVFFTFLTLKNAFERNKKYTVISFPKYGVCYSLTSEYEFELHPNGFDYKGGKNLGEVRVVLGNLPSDFLKRQMGDFQAAYTKIKNYRIVHYLLNGEYVLIDRFQAVKRMPLNLSPFRKDCDQLLKNADKVVKIPL